jgi:uncharacterized membrane protein SpoIIM required for sporulation
MSEALPDFVARRTPEWNELESLLARPKLTLDEVSQLDALYRRATNDLALAQKNYASTDVHRFLNQLCANADRTIYKSRGSTFEELRTFYSRTLPRLVRETLPLTQLSAAFLLLGVILGALTVALHPDGELILVPADIRGWISRHELWTDGILGVETPGSMALLIFLNNLRVAFFAALLGITAGLGTALVTFYNGAFLGAVVTACFRGGLGWNILTFMSAHGPVEMSIICICAGAGLHVGRALLDPGERSRRVALANNAQTSLRIVLGIAPFVVLIGIVEGFVSPGQYFPSALKIMTGALTGFGFWRWLLRSGR